MRISIPFAMSFLLSLQWIAFATAQQTVVTSEPEKKSNAVPVAERFRPTRIPDRIILTWAGDPRTTQAVTWRTSTEVSEAIAEITVADPGPNFSERAKQHIARSEKLVTNLNEALFHSVKFTELSPGTTYAYRVGDGDNWSEWFHFRTQSDKPEPFEFIYFGDAQNNLRSMWSRVIRGAALDAPQARFIIHAGDLINTAESDADWGEWFGAGGWLNGMIPSVPVPGNHEQAKRDEERRELTHHWRPQFTLFENGPKSLPETCYTFLYQNVRIIGLNSNEQIDVQTTWLEKTLAENRAPWVICTFHHPIFSTGADRDNPTQRAAWKPLFDKYRVDLVLQGHDHTYGRTGLSVPDTIKIKKKPTGADADKKSPEPTSAATNDDENVDTGLKTQSVDRGTVYVVSVSGPKMYNNSRLEFMKRVAEDTQLYQVIRVDGDKLNFEARTATGQLYDAFELRKRPGQVNELVEFEPEIAPRLRPPKKDEKAHDSETSSKPTQKSADSVGK